MCRRLGESRPGQFHGFGELSPDLPLGIPPEPAELDGQLIDIAVDRQVTAQSRLVEHHEE